MVMGVNDSVLTQPVAQPQNGPRTMSQVFELAVLMRSSRAGLLGGRGSPPAVGRPVVRGGIAPRGEAAWRQGVRRSLSGLPAPSRAGAHALSGCLPRMLPAIGVIVSTWPSSSAVVDSSRIRFGFHPRAFRALFSPSASKRSRASAEVLYTACRSNASLPYRTATVPGVTSIVMNS